MSYSQCRQKCVLALHTPTTITYVRPLVVRKSIACSLGLLGLQAIAGGDPVGIYKPLLWRARLCWLPIANEGVVCLTAAPLVQSPFGGGPKPLPFGKRLGGSEPNTGLLETQGSPVNGLLNPWAGVGRTGASLRLKW